MESIMVIKGHRHDRLKGFRNAAIFQESNHDLLVQIQMSYPIDDPVSIEAGGAGIEPTACGFGDRRSTS